MDLDPIFLEVDDVIDMHWFDVRWHLRRRIATMYVFNAYAA